MDRFDKLKKSNPKNLWNDLDECKWHPIPSLGTKWLGKWHYSENGYSLIISGLYLHLLFEVVESMYDYLFIYSIYLFTLLLYIMDS